MFCSHAKFGPLMPLHPIECHSLEDENLLHKLGNLLVVTFESCWYLTVFISSKISWNSLITTHKISSKWDFYMTDGTNHGSVILVNKVPSNSILRWSSWISNSMYINNRVTWSGNVLNWDQVQSKLFWQIDLWLFGGSLLCWSLLLQILHCCIKLINFVS